MELHRKIKVMVVDDSPLSREMMTRGLSADPMIQVVAVAGDPFEAKDKILTARPDVITCDIEMPKMNGIEFVRQLLPQYFVPIVMVSAISNAVFEAMEAGAVDFVVKPSGYSRDEIDLFMRDVIQKVKTASTVKSAQVRKKATTPNVFSDKTSVGTDIIAIGASTGGTEAIYSVLKELPPTVPGIVIVQHIPPVFSNMYAERLDKQTSLTVKEAETGDIIEPGHAYVAPGDKHLTIKKMGTKYQIECNAGEKVSGHCPSVDVMFYSVAKEAGKKSIGVLLTGMGKDGAKGLLSMRRVGARTIGQDESSSIVYGMPKVAFDIGAVERQASLEVIPSILSEWLK